MLQPNQNQSCALCRPEFCPAQKSLWGCASICEFNCDRETCDYTCPCRPDEFTTRWREVGGLEAKEARPLLPPNLEGLPQYLPLIQHSSKFNEAFEAPFAAIPTFNALATRKREQLNAMGLRQRFKLSPEAKILAISVAQDPPLEFYWRYRNKFELPSKIAEWGITAITIPNFSYFPDAPPLHTQWNFRRMQVVAEEFSKAGVAVIPHVNTLEDIHRVAWANVLRDQTDLKWVAKEFQTGAKSPYNAQHALEDLCRLQDDVGFDIHPIIIGGGRLWRQLSKKFNSFTVVDSRPFMLTIKRQEFFRSPKGQLKQRKHPLPEGTPVDALWRLNLQTYTDALIKRSVPSL